MPRPLRIVCLGGGTGLPQLITGLKLISREPEGLARVSLEDLTVVVTAFDDGGSSGRIVDTYHTLPPGDLRNCLLALADERQEPLMTRFFNHRFREDEHESLAGHSVGNLLLLTLTQVYGGDVRKALQGIRQILPVQGNILFTTLQPAVLCARLTDGSVVRGESQLAQRRRHLPIREIFLEQRQAQSTPGFPPMEGVLEALAQADVITLGPGSLYTSILPHFLVDGVADAVRRSPARRIYLCNLMTEPGETEGFRVSDHVSTLERLAGIQVDTIIANHQPVPEPVRRAYQRERFTLMLRQVTRGLERSLEAALEDSTAVAGLSQEADRAGKVLEELVEGLAYPELSLVQVMPTEEELSRDARLFTEKLLAAVEVEEGGGLKRVIRHDPLKLARAIVQVAGRAEECRGDGRWVEGEY